MTLPESIYRRFRRIPILATKQGTESRIQISPQRHRGHEDKMVTEFCSNFVFFVPLW